MDATERPLIAVTTTSGMGGTHGLPAVTLNAQYVSAIESAGGVAVLLTPAHEADSIAQVMRSVHALLLTGGEDVDPVRYGQERLPTCGEANPARDAMELAALAAARERGVPVLAICRGMQLVNVALGGTLYQDLTTQREGCLLHEQTAPADRAWHHATVARGSGLERIFGARELFINSFHHQAVDRLAPGLRATVAAEDGVIEGIEGEDGAWLYGVQWHPERGEANLAHDARDPDRRLLWAFVAAARAFARDGAAAAAAVV